MSGSGLQPKPDFASPSAELGLTAPLEFDAAYYIKLGRGGCWEADSLATDKLRLGWKQQTLDDINACRWDVIEQQLREEMSDRPRGVATADLHALQAITLSGGVEVWITFHQAKLWWTRLANAPVEGDEVSKFRRTAQPWSDRAMNGRLLVVNDLPGKIAQLQGFRATFCRVRPIDILGRTLNGTRSPLAMAISNRRAALSEYLTAAIKELHWKDFETLTDLVFRDAGWIRVSVLGQQAKAYDLELRGAITGDRYVVQVKSRADLSDLEDTVRSFSPEDYRRIFFVVHSPTKKLVEAAAVPDYVEIVGAERLAELALDAGLVAWIEDRAS